MPKAGQLDRTFGSSGFGYVITAVLPGDFAEALALSASPEEGDLIVTGGIFRSPEKKDTIEEALSPYRFVLARYDSDG
jgi:hypothetical protein